MVHGPTIRPSARSRAATGACSPTGTSTTTSSSLASDVTWSAKAATTGHGRIPYLDAGDPQSDHVLLLIHAFPVGMRMWEPVSIPSGWRAVAPALPGFDGADPASPESMRIEDY